MPLRAKLRMAGELFVPPRRDLGRAAEDPATDETVDAFGRRRLGGEFAEVMLDPMVKGVFGGNSRKLSLAAAFPRMVELERDHGGLFKAMIALGRQRKKQGKASTDAGPSGRLTSFNGGMGQLVDGLAQVAGRRSARGTASPARRSRGWPSRPAPGTWPATTSTCGPFDAVVDAAPAHAAAVQLREVSPVLHENLVRIPFAPMAVIALGFDRAAVKHDLQGFGLLIPSREKRELLGVLWTSSIFPRRAPEGKVLLRCMAGGADNPGVLELDDEALLSLTMAELRPLLGIKGAPEMVRIIRHKRAIAQYVPGHLARLAAVDRELENHPGLFLTGSSYKGISVNSCAKEAESDRRPRGGPPGRRARATPRWRPCDESDRLRVQRPAAAAVPGDLGAVHLDLPLGQPASRAGWPRASPRRWCCCTWACWWSRASCTGGCPWARAWSSPRAWPWPCWPPTCTSSGAGA